MLPQVEEIAGTAVGLGNCVSEWAVLREPTEGGLYLLLWGRFEFYRNTLHLGRARKRFWKQAMKSSALGLFS